MFETELYFSPQPKPVLTMTLPTSVYGKSILLTYEAKYLEVILNALLKLHFLDAQFTLVTQSCLTLCDPMDCSTPALPVRHQLPEFTQNSCPLSRWCHPTISSSVIPFSSCLQSFPASGSFQMSQLFASGGQNIGVSTSTSVIKMNMQDWFP